MAVVNRSSGLLLSLAMLVGATPAAAARGSSQAPAVPVAPKLRIMKAQTLCQNLRQVFSGLHPSARVAQQASHQLVEELRQGSNGEYFQLSDYGMKSEDVSTPEFFALSKSLGQAMALRGPVQVSFSLDELKHLPFYQQGIDVVVVTSTTKPLNAKRAKGVAAVARRLGIRISTVWVGKKQDAKSLRSDSSALAFITALTGGAFVDLSGSVHPCQRSV